MRRLRRFVCVHCRWLALWWPEEMHGECWGCGTIFDLDEPTAADVEALLLVREK